MLRSVEPWTIVVAILLVVAAVTTVVAVRRSRVLADTRAEASRLRSAIDREAGDRARDRADRDLLVDLLAQGVLLVDRRLQVVEANVTAHELLGRPPGSLVGRSVMEAF